MARKPGATNESLEVKTQLVNGNLVVTPIINGIEIASVEYTKSGMIEPLIHISEGDYTASQLAKFAQRYNRLPELPASKLEAHEFTSRLCKLSVDGNRSDVFEHCETFVKSLNLK